MGKLVYYLVYGVLWLFSLLPLRIHYVISDGVFLIVYYLVGYRKKLVRKNLADSFPEKSAKELLTIEKAFYHWLCDYFVETVKLLSISAENLKRHMVFKGAEKVNEIVETGQSCALYLGHYCNWEWITSLPLWFTPKAKCCQVYHVLENPWADRLFLKLRGRLGAISIPMSEVLRRLATFRQQGHPVVIGYISDQVPFWNNIHHWVDFLHHDTPVLTGTERLIRGTGQAVFYLDVRRVRRGYYPQCYLWTHNRWKRTREEFNIRYDEETGRVSLEDLETIKKRKGLL